MDPFNSREAREVSWFTIICLFRKKKLISLGINSPCNLILEIGIYNREEAHIKKKNKHSASVLGSPLTLYTCYHSRNRDVPWSQTIIAKVIFSCICSCFAPQRWPQSYFPIVTHWKYYLVVQTYYYKYQICWYLFKLVLIGLLFLLSAFEFGFFLLERSQEKEVNSL